MAQVIVVGGGFAGMSAAARLAKLRHQVVLLETDQVLGGALRGHLVDGRRFFLDPGAVTLPGVFRDLFRKSGRAMDRTLGMEPTGGRQHLFTDGTWLDLPMGRRSDQVDAVTEALGEDLWSPWIDQMPPMWEAWRRRALDQVLTGRSAFDRSARRTLRARRSVTATIRPKLRDRRLRDMVISPLRLSGHDPRTTPPIAVLSHYLERNFGRWRFDGGWPGLADALQTRLAERGVEVRTGTTALDITRSGDRVTGVVTDSGTEPADVVVWCAPRLPASHRAPAVLPVVPAARTLLELSEDPSDLRSETLVHDRQPFRLHTEGERLWTITHRSGEDPLDALARLDVDLRPLVIGRWDLSPRDLIAHHQGWAWAGWGSAFDHPGVAPVGNLYLAGAHAHPGPGLEDIGMATAAIAAAVGPVAR